MCRQLKAKRQLSRYAQEHVLFSDGSHGFNSFFARSVVELGLFDGLRSVPGTQL
jgi:hypothetical protein